MRSVFSLARRLSPCIVFLDEIDALLGSRISSRETGGAIAHRGVITEFMQVRFPMSCHHILLIRHTLQEMDGLKANLESNVIVIGATNRLVSHSQPSET